MSRLDLLRAAQFLVGWSGLDEPLPLWLRCPCCGCMRLAAEGCPLRKDCSACLEPKETE